MIGRITITSLFKNPGIHSARFLNNALMPAFATTSGLFIIPSFIKEEELHLLASNNEVSVAPGIRHVTFIP